MPGKELETALSERCPLPMDASLPRASMPLGSSGLPGLAQGAGGLIQNPHNLCHQASLRALEPRSVSAITVGLIGNIKAVSRRNHSYGNKHVMGIRIDLT